MNVISESTINDIKNHMINNDVKELNRLYKIKKNSFINLSVKLEELELYKQQGFEIDSLYSKKAKVIKRKDCGTRFEDDIWCMFYNLGFKILNKDENLRVQWGPNSGCTQQLDVVAVGEEVIFVVECKASDNNERTRKSFKKDINNIGVYMKGVSNALKQTYGVNKKVKFIFATRNFMFSDESEDKKRMNHFDIYHMEENAYNYINNLIKSYKQSVIYQFYALMFKNELIEKEGYSIPALRGKMGDRNYYLFSIEPSILLKIGFVLHRTKVNDSMAPTYQRLLVPSRLQGITNFINKGGFFPNSIIVNFESETDELKINFNPLKNTKSSKSECGLLNIPNAYGIAYIIDGQHRLYGYANSEKKNNSTIPVVAFENLDSAEQLKMFMDINENQKAVSPSLRLDLEEDLYWKSERVDSRMKALRSSIIKQLSMSSNSILYNKISIGEDNSDLAFKPFNTALYDSGLIPKGKNTLFVGESDACIYDTEETNHSMAMTNSRNRISKLLILSYNYINDRLEVNDVDKKDFFLSNRATYAIIVLIGSLHRHLIASGVINKTDKVDVRFSKLVPYLESLTEGLNNLSNEDSADLRGIQGQGAEKFWLHKYQNIVYERHNDYFPEELSVWRETQDRDIQSIGEELVKDILTLLHKSIWKYLEFVYGVDFRKSIIKIQRSCENEIIDIHQDEENFELSNYNWEEQLRLVHFKEIINTNFSRPEFSDSFAIDIGEGFKTKKDKLQWLGFYTKVSSPRSKFTLKINDKLGIIKDHLLEIL